MHTFSILTIDNYKCLSNNYFAKITQLLILAFQQLFKQGENNLKETSPPIIVKSIERPATMHLSISHEGNLSAPDSFGKF